MSTTERLIYQHQAACATDVRTAGRAFNPIGVLLIAKYSDGFAETEWADGHRAHLGSCADGHRDRSPRSRADGKILGAGVQLVQKDQQVRSTATEALHRAGGTRAVSNGKGQCHDGIQRLGLGDAG